MLSPKNDWSNEEDTEINYSQRLNFSDETTSNTINEDNQSISNNRFKLIENRKKISITKNINDEFTDLDNKKVRYKELKQNDKLKNNKCNYGIECFSRECKFIHPKERHNKLINDFVDRNMNNNSLFRNKICENFLNDDCNYGDFCRFAHGENMLKDNYNFDNACYNNEEHNNVNKKQSLKDAINPEIKKSLTTPKIKISNLPRNQSSIALYNKVSAINKLNEKQNIENEIVKDIHPRIVNDGMQQYDNNISKSIKKEPSIISKAYHTDVFELQQEKEILIAKIIELETQLIVLEKKFYHMKK
jgi:hypothetical protein